MIFVKERQVAGTRKKTKTSGMSELLEDIGKKQFRRVYLLYGDEAYLVQQYRQRLIRAACREGDSMNLNIHREGRIDFGALQDEVLAMPFFAEYRMIVLDDTKLFRAKKNSGKPVEEGSDAGEEEETADGEEGLPAPGTGTASDMTDSELGAAIAAFLPRIPETSIVVFVEQPDEKKPGGQKGKTSVDKRGKLYKAVTKYGLAVEFTPPDDEMLRKWVLGKLGAEKISITRGTLDTFLAMTGNDMSHISTETEKLISYAGKGGVIRAEDVQALTSEILEGKIFRMLDLISQGERKSALDLYNDLLELKEPTVKILILLMRQFDRLLQVRMVMDSGGSARLVAEELGMQTWQAEKLVRQAHSFTTDALRKIVERCADMQERAQSGRIDMRIGLELLILRCSGNTM